MRNRAEVRPARAARNPERAPLRALDRQQREAELRHHASRGDVLLEADADDAGEAEPRERVARAGGAALGREPPPPQLRGDQPAELRVVRPRAVELQADRPTSRPEVFSSTAQIPKPCSTQWRRKRSSCVSVSS